jgi:hypothetical protein
MKTRIAYSIFICTMFALANCSLATAQPNYPKNSAEAQVIFTDLENFVEAYSHLKETSDTVSILKEYYFDKASVGLKEYVTKHNLSAELLKDAIRNNSTKYAAIENFIGTLNEFEPRLLETLEKFDSILPNAMYPPTYLLVGADRGIAQASKFGQLVTITRVMEDDRKLTKMIVHELAHFQQAMAMGIQEYSALYGKSSNMLGLCLREGGAEFITHLVLQEITQTNALEYFEKNESDLKIKFSKDLELQNQGFWLWDSIEDKETPNLLGYVMGFKICNAYYQNASNKKAALNDILAITITQAEEFLESSSYIPE